MFEVRLSMFEVSWSSFDVRFSIWVQRGSRFEVRCSMLEVRLTIFEFEFSMFAGRCSMCGLRFSRFELRLSSEEAFTVSCCNCCSSDTSHFSPAPANRSSIASTRLSLLDRRSARHVCNTVYRHNGVRSLRHGGKGNGSHAGGCRSGE